MMTIFDPLGLIAIIVLPIKLLLQDVWRTGTKWDEPISDDQHKQWINWITKLKQLKVSIPRCYNLELSSSIPPRVELHVFVDASQSAFAAVAYFRICETETGKCALVGAKSKVAPIKPLSIPRLELQAAVLGVRLAESITEAHTIKMAKRVFWSDSLNVLGWINSDARKYKPFVALRVGEIVEHSLPKEWRYVPTNLNIADDATKVKTLDIISESEWFTGPKFLEFPEDQWPINKAALKTPTEEVRAVNLHIVSSSSNATPDPSNISKWDIFVRAQVWTLRVLRHAASKRRYKKGEYTKEELDEATKEIVRYVQRTAYKNEIGDLEAEGKVDCSSSIHPLTPFLDVDKIIRMRGRLERSDSITFDTKHPIILPRNHRITFLLIDKFHRVLCHQYNETVVNEIRQKYWIPNLRTTVRQVAKACQLCKIKNAKPSQPIMADLPRERITGGTAFAYVGLDYFGPLEVVIGRRREKRWGAVFTCLVTRAVHLEIVHSLTSDSAVMCIRRFISIRGVPVTLWTDNATTFKGANDELKRLNHEEVSGELGTIADTFGWKFIPPMTPHMGGAWERLIRSIKTTFHQIKLVRVPNDEQLATYFAEVQNILNCRPLTYVPLEPGAKEALTPNHFLLLSSNGSKTIGNIADDGLALRNRWRLTQLMIDAFWKRWTIEYLPELNRRSKWHDRCKPLQEGDVGVIWEEGTRNSWKLGRIEQAIKSSDGQVRQILIRTDTGVYKRAACKFAKIDVEPTTTQATQNLRELPSSSQLTEGGLLPQRN